MNDQDVRIVYRLLRGSIRRKPDDGPPYSIPHFRIVADALQDGRRKRVGQARVLSHWFGGPFMDTVHVDPEWQGRGIGREVVRRLGEQMDKEFAGKTVKTRAKPYDNKPLTRKQLEKLYGTIGFKPTGRPGVRVTRPGATGWRVGTGPGALEKKIPLKKQACDYTDKMVRFFEKRTKAHIDRVVANAEILADHLPKMAKQIRARAKKHDQSKYGKIERDPYIWLTEFHRCKNDGEDFEYPEGVEKKVDQATEHHVQTNRHHPEAHKKSSDMSDLDLVEMVCDWTAMSQELDQDGGSCRGWADKNIGSKWKFTDEQKRFIYRLIGILDGVNFYPKGVKKKADFAPGLPRKKEYGDPSMLRAGQILPWVVQEHAARRAGHHEDWRIGRGKMFSWAVPKGWPEPGEKRLALQQGLHREGYKHFEGEIPLGTYGAGTVKQKALGQVMITRAEPGKIWFTTAETRNPERFLLTRSFSDNKRWLLVNTTPTEILKHKKLRYAVIPPEEAEQVFNPNFVLQPKIDGALTFYSMVGPRMEALSHRTSVTGRPIMQTERTGLYEVEVPKELRDTIAAGELYGVEKKTGKVIPPQALSGILNSTIARAVKTQQEKNIELRHMLFDVRRFRGKDVPADLSYETKRRMLEQIVGRLGPKFGLPEEARTAEEQKKLLEIIGRGEHPLTAEGVVAHPVAGGIPTKIKFRPEFDVFIRRMFPGAGKYEGRAAGGFEYSHEPEGPIVGKVGTGISDPMRLQMYETPEAFIGRRARVTAQERYPTGALRAPALISLHEG